MKNLTWQNPEQLFVAQELINKVKSKCCGIKDNEDLVLFAHDMVAGYHIAQYLLTEYNTVKKMEQFTKDNFDVFFGENRHCFAEDISKNLFYLVPLTFGRNWCQLIPDDENSIFATIDNLDLILTSSSEVRVCVDLLLKHVETERVKQKICNALIDRILSQSNYSYLDIFIPFFKSLTSTELDVYWNSRFCGYDILNSLYYLLREKFWAQCDDENSKVVLLSLLCGITDDEFRVKFHGLLLNLVEEKLELLTICVTLLTIRDPFVFESLISIIAGVALRSNKLELVNSSIDALEKYLDNNPTNHIVLLDDLETLYSYRETKFKIKMDRSILKKNITEKWIVGEDVDGNDVYSFYDLDEERYYIRPLWQNERNNFKEEDVFKMLVLRITESGYRLEDYLEIQKRENEEFRYRYHLRRSYAQKYAMHALKELYGWMMLNEYIDGEYIHTLRSNVISIDPSFPLLPQQRNLMNICFMPHRDDDLSKWLEKSDIDILKKMSITSLPKLSGEWMLIRGMWRQQIDDRDEVLYVSSISQLVPKNVDQTDVSERMMNDYSIHSYAFASELCWREMQSSDEYYDEPLLYPPLMMMYECGTLSNQLHSNLYFLNLEIVKKLGLRFDFKSMSYYWNNEKVSEYYISDSNQFFFLRRDIVDFVLKEYNAKLHNRFYEQRMVTHSNKKEQLNLPKYYNENEEDLFYDII